MALLGNSNIKYLMTRLTTNFVPKSLNVPQGKTTGVKERL